MIFSFLRSQTLTKFNLLFLFFFFFFFFFKPSQHIKVQNSEFRITTHSRKNKLSTFLPTSYNFLFHTICLIVRKEKNINLLNFVVWVCFYWFFGYSITENFMVKKFNIVFSVSERQLKYYWSLLFFSFLVV